MTIAVTYGRRCGRFQRTLWTVAVLLLAALRPFVCAARDATATRPYFVLYAASIERLFQACDIVFDSVDRPDLSASVGDRTKTFRDFSGIDRSKPIGMMSLWTDAANSDIVFLPVNEIDELLKTVTFDIVGYHKVSENRFEIERPGAPYYLFVKGNYALLGDSVSSIQAITTTPDQLTRDLRDRFDVALTLDFKQIPAATKTTFVEQLRQLVEPWLQPQDNEAQESAKLRRTIGQLILELIERAVIDTSSMTAGFRLEPETRQFGFDLTFEATKGSVLAARMNRWAAQRSEFTALVSPDAPAGLAITIPFSGLVEQTVGPKDSLVKRGARLDAGLQLAGDSLGQFTLIAAISGHEAMQLNDVIPQLLIHLEKNKSLQQVDENFATHRSVVFHSAAPTMIPEAITYLVGATPELIVGQGPKSFWLAIGNANSSLERLRRAIDLVDDSVPATGTEPLIRARLHARQLPDLVKSSPLIPNLDDQVLRTEISKGDDAFSLTMEPMPNGFRLRLDAEKGLVRLIGLDWIRQLENVSP